MNIHIHAFADEAGESLKTQIAAMKRCGLCGLEARNIDGKNACDLPQETLREVRRMLDDAGLVTFAMGSPIGKIDIEKDDFAAHLERYKRTIEAAHILGTDKIRLFSFFMPKGKDPALYESTVIDRMGQFAEIARSEGVFACHENEKGIFGDTAARCARLLAAVPDLFAVFDPANFMQCGQDTWEAWELLHVRVRYMHIKDALKDGSVVPAGKGDGNVQKIVSAYIAAGGRDFTVEPHLRVFKGLADLEQKGNESRIGENFVYATNDEAFDAACAAFRTIL